MSTEESFDMADTRWEAGRYFSQHQEAPERRDPSAAPVARVVDAGGDALPFSHLDDRRFETLTFRLVEAESAAGSRVRLMQGVGEKGRDVVVHDGEGGLTTIVQCKLLRERMTAPALTRELAKLALHSYLEPGVLGGRGKVDYSLWCPGELSAPAADLIDTWPRGWTETTVKTEIESVLRTHKAFSALTWKDVREHVLGRLPSLIAPRHIGAVQITEKVRRNPDLHGSYFQFKSVMSTDDVEETLDAVVRKAMAEVTGYATLTDGDAKHLVERVKAFPESERLVFGAGYVMGLKPDLVSQFTSSEFEEFLRHSLRAAFAVQGTVMKACGRLVFKKAGELIPHVDATHRNLPAVLIPLLTMSMILKITSNKLMRLGRPENADGYERLDLDERISLHIDELWDSYEACIAKYNPRVHIVGSTEERRYRVGLAGKNGLKTRADYRARIEEGVKLHRARIQGIFDEWMKLVPSDIMVISEIATFGAEWTNKRMVDTIATMEAMRAGLPRDEE